VSDVPSQGHKLHEFPAERSGRSTTSTEARISGPLTEGEFARPNFSDLPPFQLEEPGRNRVSVGNPALKPTHANDYDLLFEHYLKSVGIVEAGWFYKALFRSYLSIQTTRPTIVGDPLSGFQQRQPTNGRNAHITGVEFAWQQHFTFLPGLLSGVGVSANYSYTTSQAKFPN